MKRTLPHHHPLAVLLVLVLLPLQACLATRHVISPTSSPEDYSRANELLADHTVQMEQIDGTTFLVTNIDIGPDSVRFGTGAAISTENFRSATYKNRLKGSGWGVASGVALGLLGPVLLPVCSEDPESQEIDASGLFGGIIGAIVGVSAKVVRESIR